MTNEELNLKITALRGPLLHQSGGADLDPDWAGSEDASAVLLEEMPNPGLSRGGRYKEWSCLPDISDLSIEIRDVVRKRAVAIAWLKWKARP